MRGRAPILWLLAILAIGAPAVAAVHEAPPVHPAAPGANPAANGAFFLVELVPMTGKYVLDGTEVLQLFTASADSAFWCGPNRPNPHSWLSRSVVCRAPVDFRIEFLDAQGDSLETLAFAGVPPGSYRLRLREQSRTAPGIYTLRYIYAGAVVDRSKVKIDEPR